MEKLKRIMQKSSGSQNGMKMKVIPEDSPCTEGLNGLKCLWFTRQMDKEIHISNSCLW